MAVLLKPLMVHVFQKENTAMAAIIQHPTSFTHERTPPGCGGASPTSFTGGPILIAPSIRPMCLSLRLYLVALLSKIIGIWGY